MNPARLRIDEKMKNTVRERYCIDIVMEFYNLLEHDPTLHAEKHPYFLPNHNLCDLRQDNGRLEFASEPLPDTIMK